jgi:hypothetical protein
MPQDIFIALNRCRFCGRPGVVVWDRDLFSCRHEVCESLAFAEAARRNRNGSATPGRRFATTIRSSFDQLVHEPRPAGASELRGLERPGRGTA